MSGAEDRAADAFDLPANPTLADLLRWLSRAVRLSIRTHVPAKVITYDPARQRATVEVEQLQVVRVTDPKRIPTNMLALKGLPPNAEATLAPFILTEIPVAWPRTAAGYITFPLAPGDEGELHVSDRSLAAWLQTGTPSDPQLAGTHALKDSVFHPGLHSDPNMMAPTDMTATVLDGAALIKIGAAAVAFLAKAQPLITALDAFANAVPVANDGGAAIQAAFKAAWLVQKPLLATVKTKAE
jgi:hypothetical protein